jgi:ubiquinone/menaquinone biosynthesis C-methylase UbiE
MVKHTDEPMDGRMNAIDLDTNQRVYATRRIVHYYTQLRLLQPAEQTILELFREQWSSMTLLDIGVGGGRTTAHFSKLVSEYVGIDYSTEMIAACQKRFASSFENTRFEVGDARDLSRFADRSFDFVLFSFNGIDYMTHGDRLQVLQEVSRVGKAGGYFCFSSHNLEAMKQQFDWKNQFSLNPITTYVNLVMLALLRWFNNSIRLDQLHTAAYTILRDESHNFRLKTYYINPQEQLNQLQHCFSDIRVFSWKDGLELKTDEALRSNAAMWLYYLCTIK